MHSHAREFIKKLVNNIYVWFIFSSLKLIISILEKNNNNNKDNNNNKKTPTTREPRGETTLRDGSSPKRFPRKPSGVQNADVTAGKGTGS